MAATTLPPIQGASGAGMNSGMSGSMKHSQPVHFAPAPPKGPPSGRLKPIKKVTKGQEAELMRPVYPTQQPVLTKRQTTAYRNTYKHNLCVEMLHAGFHKSFCELFALIKMQEDQRMQLGPESLMWNMTLLKDEHDKLDCLKTHLTRSETAFRKGDYAEVYRARFELARYFQTTGDKWLADHFFDTCLQTSSDVTTDGGKMEAEALCNVALAQEDTGDFYEALEHFEAYYNLGNSNRDWVTADGITYHTDSCIHLCRIYSTVGERLGEDDQEQTLTFLTKAYKMAKEAGQQKQEGEAAYRLGLACEKSGQTEESLVHLNSYLGICRASDDSFGIGRACDAIAKTFARQGQVEESINYLKQFVEVAEKSGQEQAYSRACHNLGNIYNTLGKYDEATKYFDKAYNLSRSMGEVSSINVNRAQFGIAMAHKMMQSFGTHVVVNKRPTLERLIEWKSARADEFDKPIPEPVPLQPATPAAQTPQAPLSREATQEAESKDQEAEQEEGLGQREGTITSTADSETTPRS